MSAEAAAPEAAGEEMEALCSQLLLPAPGRAAGAAGSPPAAGSSPDRAPPTAAAASQELLLAEASMPGEGAHAEGGDVEIFIEAVAGNVTLSDAAGAAGTGRGAGGGDRGGGGDGAVCPPG